MTFATLKLRRSYNDGDTLIRALEVEAEYSFSRKCYKVNVAETEKKENKIEKLLEKLLQQIDGLFRRRENDVSRRQKCGILYVCARDTSNVIIVLDYQFQEKVYNNDLTDL